MSRTWVVVTTVLAVLALSTGFSGAAPGGRLASGHAPRADAVALGASDRPGPSVPTTPGWINLTSPGVGKAPPRTYAGSMAYDAADAEWILFGGCDPSCPSNQTWAFVHGGWVNLTGESRVPPARSSASLTYDPNAGGLLLFGGVGRASVFLNDTWLFRGGLWTNVSDLGVAPSPREGAGMTFDAAADVNGSLLFGGCVAGFLSIGCFNDTWLWHPGAGWSPLATGDAPPPRGLAMLAYDPSASYTLLFGGFGVCGSVYCSLSDSWEFHSGAWWRVNPAAAHPPDRLAAGLAYDAPLGGLVLVGGVNGTTNADLADSWLFSSGSWTNLSAAGLALPPVRSGLALAGSADGAVLLLYGGIVDATSTPLGDTWVLETPLTVSFTSSPSAAERSQSTSWTTDVAGGWAPYALLLTFGDGGGASAVGGGPSFSFGYSYNLTGTWLATVEATDAMGVRALATHSVSVSAGPSVMIQPSLRATDVGIAVAMAALASSSAPIASYAWTFGDGAVGTTGNVSHAYTVAGTYSVSLVTTDSVGADATATTTITVNPLPLVSIGLTSAVSSSAVALLAQASGGTAPFSYSWVLGDGNRSTAAGPTHVYASPGDYNVQLWLNDSAGGSAHAASSVHVSAAPPPSGPNTSSTPTSIPGWYWGALAGIAIVTIVGAVWLLRGGRPRR